MFDFEGHGSSMALQKDGSPRLCSVDQVLAGIGEVSTLPNVAIRVIQVAGDPDSGASDLRAIVESDPALSSRVLKCVNSAAYGLRNRVGDLQRAISMLGFKQVRNLAVTASVSKIFRSQESIGQYSRPELWKHLICTGIAARMIACRTKQPNFEEVFLAGLVHDLGIVLEDQYCHQQFVQMIQALNHEETLCAVEQRTIGFDHTIIASRIAKQWKFPEEIIAAIRYHHMTANYRGDHVRTVACVDLANLICTLKGNTSVGWKLVRPSMAALDALGADRNDVKVWAEDLEAEMNQNQALFTL